MAATLGPSGAKCREVADIVELNSWCCEAGRVEAGESQKTAGLN